jgi:hypothetical protein
MRSFRNGYVTDFGRHLQYDPAGAQDLAIDRARGQSPACREALGS